MGQFLIKNVIVAGSEGSAGGGLTSDQAQALIDLETKVGQILTILETQRLS